MAGIPDRGYLTASEALTWLATGQARSREQLVELFECRPSSWGHWWPDRGAPDALELILEALRARAGSSGHGRYCALRFAAGASAILGETREMRYVHPAVSPDGPAFLRRLLVKAPDGSRRSASVSELATALAQDIDADRRTDGALKNAFRRIQNAILGGTVVAYGQRSDQPAPHFEEIPSHLFLHDFASLSLFDRLDLGPGRNRFEGVRFITSQIAALRADVSPKGARGDSQTSGAGDTVAGAPKITRKRGRPTSKSLVMAELERRGRESQLKTTLRAQAEDLQNWLRQAHPEAPQLARKTIENNASKRFWEMKKTQKPAPK